MLTMRDMCLGWGNMYLRGRCGRAFHLAVFGGLCRHVLAVAKFVAFDIVCTAACVQHDDYRKRILAAMLYEDTGTHMRFL